LEEKISFLKRGKKRAPGKKQSLSPGKGTRRRAGKEGAERAKTEKKI